MMIDANSMEGERMERARGYSRMEGGVTAAQTLSSDKLMVLRNVQGQAEGDMLQLQGALRALAVLVGSSNNHRDIDPSDFEFLFNMLIERADIIVDHLSGFRSALNGV